MEFLSNNSIFTVQKYINLVTMSTQYLVIGLTSVKRSSDDLLFILHRFSLGLTDYRNQQILKHLFHKNTLQKNCIYG